MVLCISKWSMLKQPSLKSRIIYTEVSKILEVDVAENRINLKQEQQRLSS